MRNRLSSFINIGGLAVSMSVGLLLIAFLLDMFSYDRFHEHGDRIYRITNILISSQDEGGKFASTSVKTAQLIREKTTGLEEIVLVRDGFSEDARVGDHILPLKGFWTEPSWFKVFTFPMLEGNQETALRDPYSVVITETTAKKLFGHKTALGQPVQFGTQTYQVTGVIEDVPFFSHLNFEILVSFSTLEKIHNSDPFFGDWTNMWANYVYLLLPTNGNKEHVSAQLKAIADEENLAVINRAIQLELLPLYKIVVGDGFRRSEGLHFVVPHITPKVLWIMGGLALIVILSACFNYTNLSIARAMRRFKEIGLRKAIGANNNQIWKQFLTEAIIIALAALVVSFVVFILLRPQLIQLATGIQHLAKLEITFTMVIVFFVFSLAVGVVSGIMPALFFSKVNTLEALRNTSAIKVFKHLHLRRTLVVVQFTLTLIFITTTVIGYVQYKNILAFDLGFKTENILNISLQGNPPDALFKELSEIPEVTELSRSLIVTGIGNAWGGFMKYKEARDSALVMTNNVDGNYLKLHDYKFIAGGNFLTKPSTSMAVGEVIVNQQVLKRFGIGNSNPEQAIGEEVTFSNAQGQGRKMTIVGVVQDFHYGKIDQFIEPVAFMPWTPGDETTINAKIYSKDLPATMAKIEAVWKKIDRVHPLKATFYSEAIEEAYLELSVMIKIIGFLSFLAISIASMGLFGMVVFTTETRLKEINIRKVMGASTRNLMYSLSRDFLLLLSLAALIALPVTYLFFESFVLPNFPYHASIKIWEMSVGLLGVSVIAIVMIGSQTLTAARSNPAIVLKGD